jgi:hypothetical protein
MPPVFATKKARQIIFLLGFYTSSFDKHLKNYIQD